jgi:hypothetical protein
MEAAAGMHVNRRLIAEQFSPLMVLFLFLAVSTASAQTSASDPGALSAVLSPGMTVWITDSAGREKKARITAVDGQGVTTAAGDDIGRLRLSDISRVRARRSDPLLNGALIGAGAAVASGLFLCRLTEPWRNCRDDIRPMMSIGAIGAGAGIAVDALIRRRTTIFDAAARSSRLIVMPAVGSRGGALQVAIAF